jgi:hypothetical protein
MSEWKGFNKKVAKKLKRLGAKVIREEPTDREELSIEVEILSDKKGGTEDVKITLPLPFLRLMDVHVDFEHRDWPRTYFEFEKKYGIDNIQLDWCFPMAPTPTSENMDPIWIPAVCTFGGEADGIIHTFDVEDFDAMNKGNPYILRLEHETIDDKHTYERYQNKQVFVPLEIIAIKIAIICTNYRIG